eukprot:2433309-Rhodomonas_salina.3
MVLVAYAMSGSNISHGAIALRACYAMPGPDMAYPGHTAAQPVDLPGELRYQPTRPHASSVPPYATSVPLIRQLSTAHTLAQYPHTLAQYPHTLPPYHHTLPLCDARY